MVAKSVTQVQGPKNRLDDLMYRLDDFRRIDTARESPVAMLTPRQHLSDFDQGSWTIFCKRPKGMPLVFVCRSNARQHKRTKLASELANRSLNFPRLHARKPIRKTCLTELESEPVRDCGEGLRLEDFVFNSSSPSRQARSRTHRQALGDRNLKGRDALAKQLRCAARDIRP